MSLNLKSCAVVSMFLVVGCGGPSGPTPDAGQSSEDAGTNNPACGGSGQACCANNACNSGLTCTGGQCAAAQSCGTPCTQQSDCPSIQCTCGDGSPYSYQQCTNGCCATTTSACPANNVTSGGSCLFNCNCASGNCVFGLPSTCQ